MGKIGSFSGVSKRLARRAIDFAGYDISKRSDPGRLTSLPQTDTRGAVIEFIGPAGIGKTTLCDALLASTGSRWFSKVDLRDLVLKDLDYPKDLQSIMQDLFSRRAVNVSRQSDDFWVATGRVRYAAVLAEKDLLMRRTYSRGFLLDEGLVGNFRQELKQVPRENLRPLLAHRALVFLFADSGETVAARYMKRHQERIAEGAFRHPQSYDRLVPDAERRLKELRGFRDLVSEYCPCISINVDDGFEENLSQVKAFEAEVRRRLAGGSFATGTAEARMTSKVNA